MRVSDDTACLPTDVFYAGASEESLPAPVNDVGASHDPAAAHAAADISHDIAGDARAAVLAEHGARHNDFPARRAEDVALRPSPTPQRRVTDVSAAARKAASPRTWAHRPQRDRAAFFELHFHPLVIVDKSGRILDANDAARVDIANGRIGIGANGVMRLGGRECARRFLATLAALALTDDAWTKLVVRMSDGEWRLARIRSLPGAHDAALVEIQTFVSNQDADLSPLAQAFALTTAETAVLANLLEAQSPKEISRVLGISSHTVRAHMRAIYAKLGVRARSGMMRAALRLVS